MTFVVLVIIILVQGVLIYSLVSLCNSETQGKKREAILKDTFKAEVERLQGYIESMQTIEKDKEEQDEKIENAHGEYLVDLGNKLFNDSGED